jgi:folylpolyglutamate synthase/dihydropteroate synthase
VSELAAPPAVPRTSSSPSAATRGAALSAVQSQAPAGWRPEASSVGGAPWSAEQAERHLLGLERFGMHFGLAKMGRLMALLDSPHDRFASIHVVGTNGKSSTTRMIAAILERHGVRTGSYTSPHLVAFTERIQLGEHDLAAERFGPAVQRVAAAAEVIDATTAADGDAVTQFEALTAAAYAELAAAGVEVAVIEAGLGGRYDATSVIDSRVAVLTNIGLEHTAWLGETIAEIAGEKLAVVPAGGVLVLGADLHPDAMAVARAVASEREARIVEAAGSLAPGIRLRARGAYQRRNFALAMAAAEAYLESPLDPAAVGRAAAELVVAGRFEVLESLPSVRAEGHGSSTRRAGGGSAGIAPGASSARDGAEHPEGGPGARLDGAEHPDAGAGARLEAEHPDGGAGGRLDAVNHPDGGARLNGVEHPDCGAGGRLNAVNHPDGGARLDGVEHPDGGAGGRLDGAEHPDGGAAAPLDAAGHPDGGAVTLLDGAHNPAGIAALVESLPEFLGGRRLCAVVSVLEDKDARSMLATLLPLCSRLICTAAANPRAVPAESLAVLAQELSGGGEPPNAAVEVEPDPRRAVALGRRREPDGVVLVTGSIYLISDVVRGSRPGSTL